MSKHPMAPAIIAALEDAVRHAVSPEAAAAITAQIAEYRAMVAAEDHDDASGDPQ